LKQEKSKEKEEEEQEEIPIMVLSSRKGQSNQMENDCQVEME